MMVSIRGKGGQVWKEKDFLNIINIFLSIYEIFVLLMMVSIREKGGQVWKGGDY